VSRCETKLQKRKLVDIVNNLDKTMNQDNFRGYDVNDAPSNWLIKKLARSFPKFGILWRQLFRLSPINFRQLFMDKRYHYKSMILMSMAYNFLDMCEVVSYADERRNICVDWLLNNGSQNRYFAIPVGKDLHLNLYSTTKETVSHLLTAFSGFLFLNLYQHLGKNSYLKLAEDTGDYFLEEAKKIPMSGGGIYFDYLPNVHEKIYNASAIIGGFLVRLGRVSEKNEYLKVGKKAIKYIDTVQQENGFWFYGESKKYVDNYHTGLVLFAIYIANKSLPEQDFKNTLEMGLDFYMEEFISENTETIIPRHFWARYLPRNTNLIQKVDIRDCAIGIILFSLLGEEEEQYHSKACKLLKWTLEHMYDGEGFAFEITWLWKNNIKYLESQAWIMLAISIYLYSRDERSKQ